MIGIDCAANIVDRIIEDKPDAVNPTDSSDECLYQAGGDSRCIVGEFLHVTGQAVPGSDEIFGADDLHDRNYGEYLTEEAVLFLYRIQTQADRGTYRNAGWAKSVDIDEAKKEAIDRIQANKVGD